jgi:hypothetical protein
LAHAADSWRSVRVKNRRQARRSRNRWLQSLCNRRHKNIAAVALANKHARIAWALLSKETDYLPEDEPVFVKPDEFAVPEGTFPDKEQIREQPMMARGWAQIKGRNTCAVVPNLDLVKSLQSRRSPHTNSG